MKTLTAVVCTLILTAGFSNFVSAQEHSSGKDMKNQMMNMMADPKTRSMMMADIAKNPEMRQEMMQQMMQQMKPSLDQEAEMEMHEMMGNPQMKEKMQKHLNMMQAMLDMDGSDPAKMKEMMNNPEMKSMMRMHAMCSQMMKEGKMEQDPGADVENHVHE
jgi:hypothetical protein